MNDDMQTAIKIYYYSTKIYCQFNRSQFESFLNQDRRGKKTYNMGTG